MVGASRPVIRICPTFACSGCIVPLQSRSAASNPHRGLARPLPEAEQPSSSLLTCSVGSLDSRRLVAGSLLEVLSQDRGDARNGRDRLRKQDSQHPRSVLGRTKRRIQYRLTSRAAAKGCRSVTLFGWRRRNSKCGNPNPVIEIRADEVVIRDSNDPGRMPLRFSRTQWEALERARRDQFDAGRQSEKYFYSSWDPTSRTFVVKNQAVRSALELASEGVQYRRLDSDSALDIGQRRFIVAERP